MQRKTLINRKELEEIVHSEIEALRHQLTEELNRKTNEIMKTINSAAILQGRPRGIGLNRRGPKETRMMKVQRNALIVYVTIELHKNILDVTLADAYHVWNDPENVDAWNIAAKRKDLRRGYKDYSTLYGVVKALAEKHKLNIAKITAV